MNPKINKFQFFNFLFILSTIKNAANAPNIEDKIGEIKYSKSLEKIGKGENQKKFLLQTIKNDIDFLADFLKHRHKNVFDEMVEIIEFKTDLGGENGNKNKNWMKSENGKMWTELKGPLVRWIRFLEAINYSLENYFQYFAVRPSLKFEEIPKKWKQIFIGENDEFSEAIKIFMEIRKNGKTDKKAPKMENKKFSEIVEKWTAICRKEWKKWEKEEKELEPTEEFKEAFRNLKNLFENEGKLLAGINSEEFGKNVQKSEFSIVPAPLKKMGSLPGKMMASAGKYYFGPQIGIPNLRELPGKIVHSSANYLNGNRKNEESPSMDLAQKIQKEDEEKINY